jgi:aerobic carbon-monoxide dehydrogenase medium subunit
MRPAPFDLVVPSTLEDALSAISDGVDARPLAGGQSLIAMMNLRLAVPERLIDLGRITELSSIDLNDSHIHIGAMATQARVERHPDVVALAPLVAEALGHVGHWQIRTRGTIGGNLAHADPASELPAVMLVLDAVYHARSGSGSRTILASDFNLGPYSTALTEDELLVGIDVPCLGTGETTAIVEVSRVAGAYALAGAAVWCRMVADTCVASRIAVFATGSHAVRVSAAEEAVRNARLDEQAIKAASSATTSTIAVHADLHATAAQRQHLLGVVVARALEMARARASMVTS